MTEIVEVQIVTFREILMIIYFRMILTHFLAIRTRTELKSKYSTKHFFEQ